jgi:NAD(P)-dependent dehydrogenase (short-subunit alcohol dehydrogenase family)
MALPDNPVWFITGCSTGFGRTLARIALDRGWRVAATARDSNSLKDLSTTYGKRVLALPLDVTNDTQISRAVEAAESTFGSIDVLVNNAGYGYLAAIEEGEDEEIRAVFDTNVFGLAAVTRAALPGMRTRKRGWVVNITSIGGLVGNPGAGYYAASKFAVEGLSDALSKEVAPFGVKVLIVEPGPFRTDWAGRSIRQSPEISAYAETSGARRKWIRDSDGNQQGDPVRGCEAILAAISSKNPPLRLPLGRLAIDGALAKLESVRGDIESWARVSLATDFAEVPKA